MLWDNVARVGSPADLRPMPLGLSLGADLFPDPLRTALVKAGLQTEEVADPALLEKRVRERKPEFLILTAASLAPDAEASIERLLPLKAKCPVFLVTKVRMAPESASATTRFAEVLGAGQDALGYFLMVRATLRRMRPHVMTEVLEFGKLSLDQEKFVVSFEDRQAPLTMLEFCVLGAMLDAPRMVWNKVFLNRVVFGPVDVKPGRQFDTYMSRVRRGLIAKTGADPIVAEHGMGYALAPSALEATWVAGRGQN